MTDFPGIVLQFDRPSSRPHQDVSQDTILFHLTIKSLPGFRSAMYYNINEEQYCAALSFETHAAADSALELIRPALAAKLSNFSLIKTEVVPGDIVPSP